MAASRKEFAEHLYQYCVKVVEVHDGDTIKVDFDYGFGLIDQGKMFRLAGINAPEINSKDPKERGAAMASRDFLAKLCPVGSYLLARTLYDKREKYGRYFGFLYSLSENVPNFSINGYMMDSGHARPWAGKRQPPR